MRYEILVTLLSLKPILIDTRKEMLTTINFIQLTKTSMSYLSMYNFISRQT